MLVQLGTVHSVEWNRLHFNRTVTRSVNTLKVAFQLKSVCDTRVVVLEYPGYFSGKFLKVVTKLIQYAL